MEPKVCLKMFILFKTEAIMRMVKIQSKFMMCVDSELQVVVGKRKQKCCICVCKSIYRDWFLVFTLLCGRSVKLLGLVPCSYSSF